jgi:hypothetical protein
MQAVEMHRKLILPNLLHGWFLCGLGGNTNRYYPVLAENKKFLVSTKINI